MLDEPSAGELCLVILGIVLAAWLSMYGYGLIDLLLR